jgi:putative DNA methylase
MTDKQSTSDTRLIERWLPIAEIGIESLRERTPMTPFPAPNRLHVWWARRPLVASRAAILASLLPADADHEKFRHIMGIHGDPVKAKLAIERARRTGIRVEDPYGYTRAFGYVPDEADREWLASFGKRVTGSVLDPTAGGGSIPLEAVRLGLTTFANDLNPVAALIELATVKWPTELGMAVKSKFLQIAAEWRTRVEERVTDLFPQHGAPDEIAHTYLWARTIRCPYCEGLVPLSPNWRLAPSGTGVRLIPRCEKQPAKRRCEFEIVEKLAEHSAGTVAGGDGTCPFPDCGRVIDGEEVKRQAQAGEMGEQLYVVVVKRRVIVKTKTGKDKIKWERGYRPPLPKDDISEAVEAKLSDKVALWEALDIVPKEAIPEGLKTNEQLRYGSKTWRDLFSSRQFLCHGTCAEVFQELYAKHQESGVPNEITKAAFCYLTLSFGKLLNYNSRKSVWMPTREVVANTFNRHDFAFCWSHCEMAPTIPDLGFDWAIEATADCIEELVEMTRPHEARGGADGGELNFSGKSWKPPAITLSCKSGDALDHITDNSIDCVVMDPPYYDNVMYAELSDFFYVWLKRTAGQVFPELFRRQLTDKENEAVANPAKFRDQKGAKARAGRDYQERMAAIFAECRRVLKPDGIMTLMFTHKATGAWDALTKGLMHAGFTITASWPINTEAEGSLHIKDKAAANSTIFLACRPRAVLPTDAETQYWEDVEPLVAGAVRKRVAEFQAAGIRGVDLYLASFGPALEEFSKHWPLKRGTPNPLPPSLKRAQKDLFPEEWDPYAVSPEDALDAARREVKRWRLEQLTHKKTKSELDARTSWFVLAWDAFEAPVFPYDEALRLARAVGVDLDKDIVGSLAEKKGSDMVMWDSVQRANKSALGSADGSSGMIDALHHTAYQGRTKTLEAARELLQRAGIVGDANFRSAMQAILEVLPVGTAFNGVDLPTEATGAGNDFEALEKLRRLAFSDQVEEPQQLRQMLIPAIVEGVGNAAPPADTK